MPATQDMRPPRAGDIVKVTSEDASGGENHKYEGRRLAENEFQVLQNADISIPGQRTKRLGSPQYGSLSTGAPVQGMAGWVPQPYGAPNTYVPQNFLLACTNSLVYQIDDTGNPTALLNTSGGGAITIDTSKYCQLVPAPLTVGPDVYNNSIFILDGSGNLFAAISLWNGGTMSAGQSLSSLAGLKNAAGVVINGSINTMVWFLNRMWYASGDYVYFSDVGNPLSITQAPMQVSVGDGAAILAMLTFRAGQLMMFKYGQHSSPGSIHLADVSSDDPTSFFLNVLPQFEDVNLISPQCVCRIGQDQYNAEIVFATLEGLRTFQMTALDKMVQPLLPFTDYEIDNILANYPAEFDTNFCVLYNDEILYAICNENDPFGTGTYNTPNMVLAYTTKVPKQNLLQGWTTISMLGGVNATNGKYYSVTSACQCTFGSNNGLYVGTAAGTIAAAFSSFETDPYNEVSRHNDFGLVDQDKLTADFSLTLGQAHQGAMTGNIIFDDGTTLALDLSGINTSPTTEQTVRCVLNFNAQNGNRYRGKWIDVQLSSTSAPVIIQWTLRCILEPYRRTGFNDGIPPFALTSTAVSPDTAATGALAWE